MSSETPQHLLVWKNPRHRSPPMNKPNQNHLYHVQDPSQMGRPHYMQAYWPHSNSCSMVSSAKGRAQQEGNVSTSKNGWRSLWKISLLRQIHEKALTSDCPTWNSLVATAAQTTEDCRTTTAEEERETCKARAASIQHLTPTQKRPSCGRGFHAQIGLISHLQAHCNWCHDQPQNTDHRNEVKLQSNLIFEPST